MRYEVCFNFGLEAFVRVEAENKEQAIEKASEEVDLFYIKDCHIYDCDVHEAEEI